MASDVDLGPQLESYVASLIEKGRYSSKGEVLREGVRLVQEREERLAALDAGIARGLARLRRRAGQAGVGGLRPLGSEIQGLGDREADEARHHGRELIYRRRPMG